MAEHPSFRLEGWALVLGASSGFGEATALELARRGMDILGVHLDRKPTLPNAERIRDEIRGMGRKALFFNVNAADAEKRSEVLDAATRDLGSKAKVRVLLHSLAFGTLKPFLGTEEEDGVTQAQMDMTLDVMAHSLVYWVQDCMKRGLLGEGSRVFAMTSAGGERVWPYYGPVSAAKAALESHIRQLTLELAPRGVSVNAIRAGVTDTPALRKIPGHEKMIELASQKNPSRRLTRTEDVARAITALSLPEAQWVTGNTLNVDGGEFVVD